MQHAIPTALVLLHQAVTRKIRVPYATSIAILAPVAVLWLCVQIFGELPRHTANFPVPTYLDFFAPSILAIGALRGPVFAGLGLVDDRRSGFLEQALASPASRASMLTGRMLAELLVSWLSTLVLLLVLLGSGMEFNAGAGGVVGVLAITSLLNLCYSGISFLLALYVGTPRALWIVLGTLFAASLICADAVLPMSLLPGWIGAAERIDPLAYGIHALRPIVWHQAADQPIGQNLAVLSILTCLSLGLALSQAHRTDRYIL